MKILIACECSGRVRNAFAALGHDAWSCDLKPSETPGQHLQCDVLTVLHNGWEIMVGHPVCKYLANSGVSWLHKQPERWELMREGAEFFKQLLNAPISNQRQRLHYLPPSPQREAEPFRGLLMPWPNNGEIYDIRILPA